MLADAVEEKTSLKDLEECNEQSSNEERIETLQIYSA